RLSDIWTADDRQLESVTSRLGSFGLFFLGRFKAVQSNRLGIIPAIFDLFQRFLVSIIVEEGQGVFNEFDNAIAMGCGNRPWLTQAQFMELSKRRSVPHALCLVHSQKNPLAGLAQQLGYFVVVGIDAGTRVHQKDDDVGFSDCLMRL